MPFIGIQLLAPYLDTLENIIFTLSSDEVRRFKILSNRFKADEEKKLLVLFDALREHEFMSDDIPYDTIITRLYGNSDAKSKNSYYRLRNKLLGNIEKSLLFYHFNYHNNLEPHSFVQIAYLMRSKGLYQEAGYYLKKAEKIAEDQQQWALLEVIYVEMLQLVQQEVDIDIDWVARRKVANRLRVLQFCAEQELIARICDQVKRKSSARTRKPKAIVEIITATANEIPNGASLLMQPSLQIALYKALSQILQRKGAYMELVVYIEYQTNLFQKMHIFTEENHALRLTMHIWHINSLRKLLRFEEEAQQLITLEQELHEYEDRGWKEYAFYYYNAKINNQKLLNKLNEATLTIKEALASPVATATPQNTLYLYLSLADLYFCEDKISDALKVIRKRLVTPEAQELLSPEMNLYIGVFELICVIENADWEYAIAKTPLLRRRHRLLLKEAGYVKANLMLETITNLCLALPAKRRSIYEEAWRNFKHLSPTEIADNHIIVYEQYLRAKALNTQYYQTLLSSFVE